MNAPEDQPEFVDEILVHLQRADPGEIESGELEDLIGADREGMRTAVEWMNEQKLLDPDAQHFKLLDASKLPQHEAPPEAQLDPETPESVVPPPAPGDVPVRLRLGLTATFGRSAGDDDEAIVKRSELLYEQIRDVLNANLRSLDIFLEVEGIETYDKPRVIFSSEQ